MHRMFIDDIFRRTTWRLSPILMIRVGRVFIWSRSECVPLPLLPQCLHMAGQSSSVCEPFIRTTWPFSPVRSVDPCGHDVYTIPFRVITLAPTVFTRSTWLFKPVPPVDPLQPQYGWSSSNCTPLQPLCLHGQHGLSIQFRMEIFAVMVFTWSTWLANPIPSIDFCSHYIYTVNMAGKSSAVYRSLQSRCLQGQHGR